MKERLKKIIRFMILYLILTIIFTVLMFCSYLLPNFNIRGHIEESIAQLKNEGIGYTPFYNQPGAMLDTHTDALMLNIAFNKGMNENQSDFARAVENSFLDEGDMVHSLDTNVHSGEYNNHEYSRYWHGIQVVLRPLLLFFNYTEIRYLLMIVFFILLGLTFSMIGKQLGTRYIVAFALTISFMYAIIIPTSLQYSCMFIIMLLATITTLFLYKMEKQKYLPYLFFIIGALSTYFDLLTYPLITLGIPLIITLIYENNKKTKLSKLFIIAIELGILWSLGYILLFATKWLVASVILHRNAIIEAIDALFFRVNGNEQYPVTRTAVLKNNFNFFFVPLAKYIMIAAFLIWIGLFVFFRKKINEMKAVLPIICIAIIPYLWYILLAGHSSIHSWFTNKIQAVTAFAILSIMCVTIKERNLE